MKTLIELPSSHCLALEALLLDIDDTLTTDGKLEPEAYGALGRLRAAGLRVVPVTGRPAGWCDLIARFWPVDGVVGENGAFYYCYDHQQKRMRRVHAVGDAQRRTDRGRLDEIAARILSEVPGAALSADQPFRVADLAIDFCEDVIPLLRGLVHGLAENQTESDLHLVLPSGASKERALVAALSEVVPGAHSWGIEVHVSWVDVDGEALPVPQRA